MEQEDLLFTHKGLFCIEKPSGFTLKGNMSKGSIKLTNKNLTFIYSGGDEFNLPLTDISKVEKVTRRMYTMMRVYNTEGKFYTFWAANLSGNQYLGGNTNQLIPLLENELRK